MKCYKKRCVRTCLGNPKFGLFTLLHGQNSSSPCTAISAMLDSKGRTFVLIQVPYLVHSASIFRQTSELKLLSRISESYFDSDSETNALPSLGIKVNGSEFCMNRVPVMIWKFAFGAGRVISQNVHLCARQ